MSPHSARQTRQPRRRQSHDQAALTAQNWPIAAGLLPFPDRLPDGTTAQERGPEHWGAVFKDVRQSGFEAAELTDTWLKVADLGAAQLHDLSTLANEADIQLLAVALIRRSVIDQQSGDSNLDYSHRAIDAAASLNAKVVSVGLHEPLTPEQKQATWFWTEVGPHNDPADRDRWELAVTRLRELGAHASEVGLLLSLEMYEDTYLGTADSAVALVDEIGLDNVGLNPDTGNLIRLHRPVEPWDEVLARTLPYANYWHVKNYTRDERPQDGFFTSSPAPLELGLINYRAGLDLALRLGYAGILTCEHYGGDGLSVSATNLDYLRRILHTPSLPIHP